MPLHFVSNGKLLFGPGGKLAMNDLCCCYIEPVTPCPQCNTSQTPNRIEVVIPESALVEWSCGGICSSIAGTYILNKVEDADCYYTYCEDDPCNGESEFHEPYIMKVMAQIFAQDAIAVYLMFGTTQTFPDCSSVFNQVRMSSWTYGLGNPLAAFDCLDTIDYDVPADLNDASVDFGFCHAQNTVHARAIG